MEAVFKTETVFTQYLHFDKNASLPPNQLKLFIQLSGLTIVGYRWKKINCHLPFRNCLLLTHIIHNTVFLCFSFHLLQIPCRFIHFFGLILYQCSRNPSEARLPGQAVTVAFRWWDPFSTEQTGLSKLLDCWHIANVTSSAAQHWWQGRRDGALLESTHTHTRTERKRNKNQSLTTEINKGGGIPKCQNRWQLKCWGISANFCNSWLW